MPRAKSKPSTDPEVAAAQAVRDHKPAMPAYPIPQAQIVNGRAENPLPPLMRWEMACESRAKGSAVVTLIVTARDEKAAHNALGSFWKNIYRIKARAIGQADPENPVWGPFPA
jgi:hypothetical protein